ncbi:MAG: MarR family winged helix-turn-helix transcriptional regulator [Bacteroidia bacterium]
MMINDSPDKSAEQLELEGQLRSFRDALRMHQVEVRTSYDISATEMEIVLYVDKNGPQKMKQVGELFDVKFSTLTSLVDKIENSGLVRRAPSKDDRRSIMVMLTKKGKKMVDDYDKQIESLANFLISKGAAHEVAVVLSEFAALS